MAPGRRPARFALVATAVEAFNGPNENRAAGPFKLLAGLFHDGIGVNFPMAVQGSGRDRPGPIAGFGPLQQLRRFSKQPSEVRSRDAQLAKLGGGDRRDFVFLDGDIAGAGGHACPRTPSFAR